MNLETTLADYHEPYFFREFTYSSSLYKRGDGQEVELCDGAIWIRDLLILIQLKERDSDHESPDADAESKWFWKKVSKHAVNQLVNSLEQLRTANNLPLQNLRGQIVDVSLLRPNIVHKLAMYRSGDSLPLQDLYLKGRVSERGGFIHFIHIDDYVNVCRVLHTPMEISDYLHFRAEASQNCTTVNELPEKALLGKYLTDSGFDDIEHADELYVDDLIDNREQFAIGNLLRTYLDRIQYGNEGTQYHAILSEIASLRRGLLEIFRSQLLWAMDTCRREQADRPARFYDPEGGCSFVFVPLVEQESPNLLRAAQNYTHLSKYDFRSSRAMGVAIAPDASGPDACRVQWYYVDFPWEKNDELQKSLEDLTPFGTPKGKWMGKYGFK